MNAILARHATKEPKPFHAADLTALDRTSKIIHSSGHGTTTVDPTGPAVSEDSISWIPSITKIFTAVAVMIVVERVLISVVYDIGKVVPQLTKPDILVGFGEDGMR